MLYIHCQVRGVLLVAYITEGKYMCQCFTCAATQVRGVLLSAAVLPGAEFEAGVCNGQQLSG